MRKIFSTIAIVLIISACSDRKKDNLSFTVLLNPSFHERATIELSKTDGKQQIQLLIKDRPRGGEKQDTFYYKTILLSKGEFDKFNANIIQKTKIKQPPQWEGCCDGMPVNFLLIQNNDTSRLYFRSPDIKRDTLEYRITKTTVDNLRSLTRDSIINDYLDDIEWYMDESKRPVQWKDNRAINKLRKIEYSRWQ
jgi:hypothetical protein